ncbi:MAG TPA: M14 family metallopeptidase [Phototrophicaceae bacterium]|nr:M14 family metallopeptidase [Phototrophicaceae bacterium]
MPQIEFDRFYRYDDLTHLLHAFAAEFPQLVQIESLGKSYEGRDLWVLTVTNTATGPASEKPAFWVDGNIHASELAASAACLYFLNKLTREYGQNAELTRCLDTRAFYVCPRLNPDGAEWALADKPKIIRSGTRPYPYDEEPLGGIESEDIDGDGRALFMRIPDPNGGWKAHSDEPRLLVRRDPTETGGTYYRVLPEGYIKDYDGVTIQMRPRQQGLDFNRNFPLEWRQESEQRGAGPFPTSEPEIHAAVQFIASHTNITGGVTFHTYSGVLLRPYGTHPDEHFPAEDLWTFQKIGQKGTELTGYPNVSVYHDFRYHPKEYITGVFDDWLYEHLGLYAWTVELWSPQRQAGIAAYKYTDWSREHPVEDDFKLLKWNDEALSGQGYVNWYPFEHPQLGRVELGGWDFQLAWRNPPPQFLEKEITPFPDWLIWNLLISPRLELYQVQATSLGGGNYAVRLVVQNTGWLPSYISKKALEKKTVRGVIAEIELPAGAVLKTGKVREEFGQLEGRAYQATTIVNPGAGDVTGDRAKVEWVIYAPEGGIVKLTAKHERAGTVRAEVQLQP